MDSESLGQHCGPGLTIERSHDFEPLFLRIVEPLNSVVGLLHADARDPAPRGRGQPEKTGEFADMYAQTLVYGLFAEREVVAKVGLCR